MFPMKCINSNDSNCYLDSFIQCLIHINEFANYFLNEYPNISSLLKQKNKKGDFSESFYNIIKDACENNSLSNNESKTFKKKSLRNIYKNQKYINLENFKNILFSQKNFGLDKNNCKNYILSIFQIMHEELNYLEEQKLELNSNQILFDKFSKFNSFNNIYNMNNLSIISKLFYGTIEEITKCNNCQTTTYNFQKFSFISFNTTDYAKQLFNINDGFEDYTKTEIIRENDGLYCPKCKKVFEAESYRKIIEPPKKLLINIEYNEDDRLKPIKVDFKDKIDISKYTDFSLGLLIEYELICICTYINDFKNNYNNYFTYCKDKRTDEWYYFNEQKSEKINLEDIYLRNPYILLYEKI